MSRTTPFLMSVIVMAGLTAACDQTATTTQGGAQTAEAVVTALPLKRGFYVTDGTPCAQASNATLLLVTREGVNGSRDVCTFTKIEKTGATSYRVTELCSNKAATVTYDVPNETSFRVTYESSGDRSARYCAQSSLPEPWRDNDISDLIGHDGGAGSH